MSERKKTPRSKQINGFSIGLIASLVWGAILWSICYLIRNVGIAYYHHDHCHNRNSIVGSGSHSSLQESSCYDTYVPPLRNYSVSLRRATCAPNTFKLPWNEHSTNSPITATDLSLQMFQTRWFIGDRPNC